LKAVLPLQKNKVEQSDAANTYPAARAMLMFASLTHGPFLRSGVPDRGRSQKYIFPPWVTSEIDIQ
jgi:hypothetical protein